MKSIAILGGGISGLVAAYECQKLGLDWHLYEGSDRLGGVIQTTLHDTPEGRFVIEGGPDGWVSEKPWMRELVEELGLSEELIASRDSTRKTYILKDGCLEAIPDGMRMMVPTDLAALENSPLFSAEARRAYAAEIDRAEELKTTSPLHDESVAEFVRRHFGNEVLETLAAPLLSGVFGGDVHKLSVRAVMPQFVAMEREYGSLITALQHKQQQAQQTRSTGVQFSNSLFTSFRNGMQTLTDRLVERLPAERIHLNREIDQLMLVDEEEWTLLWHEGQRQNATDCSELIVATPLDNARRLLAPLDRVQATLLPGADSFVSLTPDEASSAVLAAFTWSAAAASQFEVPAGFGFLVPPGSGPDSLLACTFVDQKYPERTPEGARILRAFFGGASAARLMHATDAEVAAVALQQLRSILGPTPEPEHVELRRLPRSLPQYEVGHLNRMAQLEKLVNTCPRLHLLGNSYRGVGLPDLVRNARETVSKLAVPTAV